MRAAVLFLLIGCVETTTEVQPPVEAKPVPPLPPPPRLPPWRGNQTLPMLPSDPAKLEAYAAATKAWHTATTAYSLGDAVRSAESFLEAAAHLKGGPEPIAKAFAAGRCLAYENAARAYSAAGRHADAQAKLAAASTADPACQHSIAAAVERLKEK